MRKAAIVTGSSRGIGAACAQSLAASGWSVAVNWRRDRDAAQAVVESIRTSGGDAAAFGADVGDPQQAKALYDAVKAAFGTVGLVVNNAGISLFSLAQDTTDEQWREIFRVNVDGVFHMCRAAVPDMIRAGAGRIVNIGSMWGEVGSACESAYSATKAAVIGYTKALAKELGPSGITVNCVCPGFIDTEMNAALGEQTRDEVVSETPLGRTGTPQDVADAVCFFANSASFVTGQILDVSGGLVIR